MSGSGFSPKQRKVLTWWRTGDYDAVICDGAVRSGKSYAVTVAFFLWAMVRFQRQRFGLCAPTINGARRNLLAPVRGEMEALGFRWEERLSRNQVVLRGGGRENTFYLYGGRNEASASLIQGVTLAGALLDEVALMPRSFVEQAVARCSLPEAKVWFSCNPAGQAHWFYREWIQRAEEKRALYLHFTMDDNPALTRRAKERYRRMFRGVFYRRYVLGEWVSPEGLVYDFFDPARVPPAPRGGCERWRISCDYGTRNPASFGLWGLKDGVWYRVREFYYDAAAEGSQRTDGEYVQDLERLAGGRRIEAVIVDPSAASFIEALRRKGWPVRKADNRVIEGIRRTAAALKEGRVVICKGCGAALREFGLYRWEDDGTKDRVHKEHDHAMDDIRYFVMSLETEEPLAAVSVERRAG